MYYVYKNHMNQELWFTENEISEDELNCEDCGDADICVGTFNTQKEAEDFIKTYKG